MTKTKSAPVQNNYFIDQFGEFYKEWNDHYVFDTGQDKKVDGRVRTILNFVLNTFHRQLYGAPGEGGKIPTSNGSMPSLLMAMNDSQNRWTQSQTYHNFDPHDIEADPKALNNFDYMRIDAARFSAVRAIYNDLLSTYKFHTGEDWEEPRTDEEGSSVSDAQKKKFAARFEQYKKASEPAASSSPALKAAS